MRTHADRQRSIDAAVAWTRPAVFETITGEHWRRAIARARSEENSVAAQIRARLQNFGTVNPQHNQDHGR